ncbi:MAG: ArsR/SmtB family transcription factor [Candidatus Binatia bacterium]
MTRKKELVQIFKALSDLTRLRIMKLLVTNRTQICVCEFVDTLQERQYNVSRQLKVLETAGLIEGERDGHWIYYGLAGGEEVFQVLHRLVATLPDPEEVFAQDQERFERRMELREGGRCRIGIQTEFLTK